ncbi:hypothetical protein HDA32_004530 [Spinactinospora alkalitolerans]|uniref:Uncharacterized protein n=1 Tax=Spinactinospora alkalitolerans TaxID=687207 RepID=A0A852U675_9ACTN|nr:hypothetical protein [Spinactinospora alkalitolerans]NYE49410.1 hypothetical protein [Spinactinospora alkalitolerans]
MQDGQDGDDVVQPLRRQDRDPPPASVASSIPVARTRTRRAVCAQVSVRVTPAGSAEWSVKA